MFKICFFWFNMVKKILCAQKLFTQWGNISHKETTINWIKLVLILTLWNGILSTESGNHLQCCSSGGTSSASKRSFFFFFFYLRFKNIGYNYFLSFILRGGYRGISFIKWNNTNPIKILPPHQSASAFKQSIIWVFPVKPIVNFCKYNI